MSKTTRRLLKVGPTENSTRVTAGIRARKLIQVALVVVGIFLRILFLVVLFCLRAFIHLSEHFCHIFNLVPNIKTVSGLTRTQD